MTDKKISVVMAVYNGIPYVQKAIDSVLSQSYPVSELVVFDDGSFDGTPKLLAGYKDSRILVRRFENAGVAVAMNRGLELATGDYVAFMDHDDVWFRDKLKKQMAAVSRYPTAGFVCCNYAVRPPGLGGRLVKHFSKLESLKGFNFDDPILADPLRRLLIENFVGTSSTVLVSRAVIRKAGFLNRDYRITGDYDYWLRCAALTDFAVLPDVLFYKRTHAANISANESLTICAR